MSVAVISSNRKISALLEKHGFTVITLQHGDVPSLTRLMLDQEDLTDFVIEDIDPAPWSAAHVMSTARHIQSKGSFILLGSKCLAGQCSGCPFIIATEELSAVPQLLRNKNSEPKTNPAGGTTPIHIEQPKAPELTAPEPLAIPRDKIVYVGVVGSQMRIGCTTQAIALWHYCKALGFSPAIASGAAQIAQIAGVMESAPIEYGHLIEEIPFVTDTALDYDCYILDMGTEADPSLLGIADIIVLVAGSKPWELLNTTAAARNLSAHNPEILLSFSKDARTLQPLFDSKCFDAPWIPDIWHPSSEAFSLFEQMLRPKFLQVLSNSIPELALGNHS